jgi:hypothetical protein
MNSPNRFSPREFLKARRPERFSDSVSEASPVLDRTLLEYHLHTLTSRSQETDFQNFARRLAEKEVCPNLLPQTGPTGGGDSKVDSETYPVADDLSLAWFVGEGRQAASERWAFAMSAKADWRTKVRCDIRKIAKTERGYAKAFYISNQFIPDRDRASVEDELRKKYQLDVRILDRTWILDKVFAGRHEALAIEHLRLQPQLRTEIRKGPRDLEREEVLKELESRIQAATQSGKLGFQFTDDCIEAAIASRGLELPRTETDGRFIRAEKAATEYGTEHQNLRCAYEYAWTAIFWHEDFCLGSQLYATVESRARGTQNCYDLELLTNLWNVLFSLVHSGRMKSEDAQIEPRAKTLIEELTRLSQQEDRPSNALHAQCTRLLVEMFLNGPDGVDASLDGLRTSILKSRGLVGFPLQSLVEALTAGGQVLGDFAKYDALYETIIELVTAREGEIAAAKLLTRRGAQELEADHPVEAVRLLGRSLANLFKNESRHELVQALALCGAAYERLGLIWAARGTTLTAASLATDELWTYADVTPAQASCYRRMKWLELQLGRVPHLLAWHDVDLVIREVLIQQGYSRGRIREGDVDFDAILAILILRTDIWQLKWLSGLPDVLDRHGLFIAADSLRYALGHEDGIAEAISKEATDSDALAAFFLRLRDQPAGNDLPRSPEFCDAQMLTFSSVVLGCHVTAECDNNEHCVALTESILAALESLLACGLVDRFVAREPRMTLRIRQSFVGEGPFAFDIDETRGHPHFQISTCRKDPDNITVGWQAELQSALIDLLGAILARVFFFGDTEETLRKLFGDDRALERAIAFTSSFVSLGNVLGKTPRMNVSSWLDSTAKVYPLKREEAWDAGRGKTASQDAKVELGPSPGVTREDFRNHIRFGRLKHSQVQILSPIRETLWEEARWTGNAFAYIPGEVPVLAPVFTNAGPAAQIFSHWRSEFGAVDSSDRLRVSVIRGIRRDQPHAYRVVFGGNPKTPWNDETHMIVAMARIHTMEPPSDTNLSAFLRSFQEMGRYVLAHGIQRDSDFDLVPKNSIGKLNLHLREAWQIGRDDLESAAIHPDDDPIIPPDQPGAPVLTLLEAKRNGDYGPGMQT